MPLPPIHEAARIGDVAEVTRLIETDPSLLNAQVEGVPVRYERFTALLFAAEAGRVAVVEKLLALGTDTELRDWGGNTAVHLACYENEAEVLALLLDAGASVNTRDNDGGTPLMYAATECVACVELLLSRCSGEALGLDARDNSGRTALFHAADENCAEAVRLLLDAGANPTIPNKKGVTALDRAQTRGCDCIGLLEAAVAEPEPARLLLKARALLDTAVAVPKAAQDPRDKGLDYYGETRAVLEVAPAYLKGRVAWARELPRVSIVDGGASEQLIACLEYALGLKYGGAVHFEGQEPPPPGMVKEVFIELCEMLVPKWARAEM